MGDKGVRVRRYEDQGRQVQRHFEFEGGLQTFVSSPEREEQCRQHPRQRCYLQNWVAFERAT